MFMVHVAIWKQEEIAVDSDKKAQIKIQIRVQSGVQSRA